MLSKPFHKVLALKSVELISADYGVLQISDSEIAGLAQAGNFFEIKPSSTQSSLPHLFKPISLYKKEGDSIYLMIKALGQGSRELLDMKAGQNLEIIGPLGNSFPLCEEGEALLVSGGIGYPPLYQLKNELPSSCKTHWIHGGNCRDDIFPCDESWSMDGSIGRQGYVSEGVLDFLDTHTVNCVYSCGPEAMLKAIATICKQMNTPLYVSMEAYMACGVGVCYGCAIPIGTAENWTYKRVCKEGPVFDAAMIRWDLL